MYVQGHLLNDNLGGPGRAYNLTPITGVAFGGAENANRRHLDSVEQFIKPQVEKGEVVRYKVTVLYGRHADRSLQGTLRTRIQEAGARIGTPQEQTGDQAALDRDRRKLEIMDYEQNNLARALNTTWNILKFSGGNWVVDDSKPTQPIIGVINMLPSADFDPLP